MSALARLVSASAIVACLLSVNACNDAETITANSVQPSGENQAPDLLYSEAFSGSGEFAIVRDAEGNYGYRVQAPIGSEAAKRMESASSQLSVIDVYRSLYPGNAPVPAIVNEVSEKMGSGLISENSNGSNHPPVEMLPKAASFSDFSTRYCRSITEGEYIWKFVGCFWLENDTRILTPWVDSDGFNPNRVYAWNATPHSAQLTLWNSEMTRLISSWKPMQSPFTVSWFQWGGTYSQAKAQMQLPTGKRGELGIVTHFPTPRPPR